MNPAPPTFRAFMDDLNHPALQVLPNSGETTDPLPPLVRALVSPKSTPKLDQIERLVASEYGFTIDQLHAPTKEVHLAGPRMLVMYLALELSVVSEVAISKHFQRIRGTAFHAHQKIKALASVYPELHAVIVQLRAKLQEAT